MNKIIYPAVNYSELIPFLTHIESDAFNVMWDNYPLDAWIYYTVNEQMDTEEEQIVSSILMRMGFETGDIVYLVRNN